MSEGKDWGSMSREQLRTMILSSPSRVPPFVRVRIRWVTSGRCKREYENSRKLLKEYCVRTGICPPARMMKATQCIMFRADAKIGGAEVTVGYLLLILNWRRDGFLYDVFVARNWRNHGIGTALTRAALLFVKKVGGRKVRAYIMDERAAKAMRLYGIDVNMGAAKRILEKLGFRRVREGLYEYVFED